MVFKYVNKTKRVNFRVTMKNGESVLLVPGLNEISDRLVTVPGQIEDLNPPEKPKKKKRKKSLFKKSVTVPDNDDAKGKEGKVDETKNPEAAD